ncbi:MAG: MORN motif-containing protein, partial [Trichodesmium sp. St17_bin3_1_1]|nr:MORN motif-containing protein [Trichodesmium sp. St17_bin3_1_1]
MLLLIKKLRRAILTGSCLGYIIMMWYPQPLIAQEQAEAPFCQGNPPTGRVKCNYPNGDNYTGDFVNGRPQGSGVYVYANRDRYEGQFRNGLPNGQGTFIFSNDARVKGVFQNGQIRSGTITFENGDRFVGDFKLVENLSSSVISSQPTGQGEFIYANGDRYKGEFFAGSPFGPGVFT